MTEARLKKNVCLPSPYSKTCRPKKFHCYATKDFFFLQKNQTETQTLQHTMFYSKKTKVSRKNINICDENFMNQ